MPTTTFARYQLPASTAIREVLHPLHRWTLYKSQAECTLGRMLLAEIHGKRCAEAENNEDWLTSAIFGHLRSVPPHVFWGRLFSRAMTVEDTPRDLNSELLRSAVRLENYTSLSIVFWQSFERYGEPDLLLRFSGPQLKPVVIMVEVKLHASKSGTGDNDQLARYLDLLDDSIVTSDWITPETVKGLVYLTASFAATEIRESIAASKNSEAVSRIFGLQWQDVLDAASQSAEGPESILSEVATFLRGRGFEAFDGFHSQHLIPGAISGSFYGASYFRGNLGLALCGREYDGHFYE